MSDSAVTWAGVLIFLLAVGGWIANVVKLAGMCCDLSGMLLVRVLGVAMPPLGSVLGYL